MTRLPAALRWPCGYSYRRQVGYQEWLLPIDFAKREEFAYACEAYGRIRERAKNQAERRRLHPFLSFHLLTSSPSDLAQMPSAVRSDPEPPLRFDSTS